MTLETIKKWVNLAPDFSSSSLMNPIVQTALALLLLATALSTHAAPKVIASIKPIHSLVSNVMQGVGHVELLIKGNHSPHTFTLKPSDVRKLSSADVVFWVGETLETPLQNILHSGDSSRHVIELIDTPNLKHISTRALSSDKSQNHDHHSHVHHRASFDSHIWLSPYNAQQLVLHISHTLAQIDPTNAALYETNAQNTLHRIQQLDQQIDKLLRPVQNRPYIVFHNAYQHFERHYQLDSAGVVTLGPERLPGAKHIGELREIITQRNVVCVFDEAQFKPKLMQSIVEGHSVATATLDPLGSTLSANADAWFNLMYNLASSFSDCLSRYDQ